MTCGYPQGGPVKSRGHRSRRTCAPLIRRFFFGGPEILGNQKQSKKSKPESFQRAPAAERSRTSHLFSPPPGAVKSLESFNSGPAAPQHKEFREFRENFFRGQAFVA